MAPETAERGGALARLVRAVDDKGTDLPAQLHPAWVDAVFPRPGLAIGGDARRADLRVSQLLAAAYELRWPTFGELRHPAHRIALLGRQDTLRVLAVCALASRRDSLRVSVGRETRETVIECVGAAAYAQLVSGSPSRSAPIQALTPQMLDIDQLATSGYRLLCRHGAWHSRAALAITRLCLAPMTADSLAGPPADATGDAEGAEVVNHLQDFFPELEWLFGSGMKRALSA